MVTEPASLENELASIRKAQAVFSTFTQSQVDRIFFEAAKAAATYRYMPYLI